MPKNIIWGAKGKFAPTEDGETPVEDLEPSAGHLIYQRGAILRWSKAPHGSIELGVAVIETSVHSEVDKHYLTLDRTGVNKLIHDLRAARDQAFGRDE